MTNETTQPLTFEGYINERIQAYKELLPRANSLAKETIDTYLDVLGVIETLDPEKPDQWYQKTAAIADAVMAANSGLDLQQVTTAVANDMEDLYTRYINELRTAGPRH